MRALQLGYRMIDTACDYGSQPGIGAALRQSGIERASVYLVAKVEETDEAYGATGRYLAEIGVECLSAIRRLRAAKPDCRAHTINRFQLP